MNTYTIIGWVLLVPVVLIVLFAAFKMRQIHSTYARYCSIEIAPGVTGERAGRQMLDMEGLQAVPVQELGKGRKPWESYYDMTEKVLRLSPDVFRGGTASDIGMVAYECGHAIEHNQGINAQARQRMGILALAGTNLGLLLFVVGIAVVGSGMNWGVGLVGVGFLIFVATAVMVLNMLPVEKGTAKRAEALLEKSGLTPMGSEAQKGALKMISASIWYYVGALSSIVGMWLG